MKEYRVGPETSRMTYREFKVSDAEDAFALNGNADVMRYTGEPPLQSIDAARQFIANYSDFDRMGYGRWACVLKETQSVIGFCGLKYLQDVDEVDVGFRFVPSVWGLGLATEACRASLAFGIHTLKLDRIVAYVMPENLASIRVLEKSGMTFESDFDYDGIATLRFITTRIP